MRLRARHTLLRAATSAAAWSLGFVLLHAGGACGKLGVIAPGLAVLLLALLALLADAGAKKRASSDVRLASETAILS